MTWAFQTEPRAPAGPGAAPAAYQPPTKKLRTLGLLKHLGTPYFSWFEMQYLYQVQQLLTTEWWCLQSCSDERALRLWISAMRLMELDRKAARDLFLLAHSGLVGRTQANKVLWTLLSGPAISTDYEDLSALATHLVYQARKTFDRPPREHGDLRWWSWECYSTPRRQDLKWGPNQVPAQHWMVQTGRGGMPLPPPWRWSHQ